MSIARVAVDKVNTRGIVSRFQSILSDVTVSGDVKLSSVRHCIREMCASVDPSLRDPGIALNREVLIKKNWNPALSVDEVLDAAVTSAVNALPERLADKPRFIAPLVIEDFLLNSSAIDILHPMRLLYLHPSTDCPPSMQFFLKYLKSYKMQSVLRNDKISDEETADPNLVYEKICYAAPIFWSQYSAVEYGNREGRRGEDRKHSGGGSGVVYEEKLFYLSVIEHLWSLCVLSERQFLKDKLSQVGGSGDPGLRCKLHDTADSELPTEIDVIEAFGVKRRGHCIGHSFTDLQLLAMKHLDCYHRKKISLPAWSDMVSAVRSTAIPSVHYNMYLESVNGGLLRYALSRELIISILRGLGGLSSAVVCGDCSVKFVYWLNMHRDRVGLRITAVSCGKEIEGNTDLVILPLIPKGNDALFAEIRSNDKVKSVLVLGPRGHLNGSSLFSWGIPPFMMPKGNVVPDILRFWDITEVEDIGRHVIHASDATSKTRLGSAWLFQRRLSPLPAMLPGWANKQGMPQFTLSQVENFSG